MTMSESRFYMWRCIVALAHADGTVTPPEREMIWDALEREELLSKEQREEIMGDMDTPRSVDDLLGRVREGQDRQDLLIKARDLLWRDEIMGGMEERMMRRLRNTVNYGFDINEMMREARDDFDPLQMRIDDDNNNNQ